MADNDPPSPHGHPEPPEWHKAAISAFPFERVTAAGERALAVWEEQNARPGVAPVIIGGEGALGALALPFSPEMADPTPEPTDAIAEAETLDFPHSIQALRREEAEASARLFRESPELRETYEKLIAERGAEVFSAEAALVGPLGDWPETPPAPTQLAAHIDPRTGGAFETVTLVLVETEDWTTIPAHLRWGGWNANPPAAHHVAALRSWRARYGAELVALGPSTMELRVARRPATPEEAMALAHEHFWHCNDLVTQSTGDLSTLAAKLMVSHWWWFWWD